MSLKPLFNNVLIKALEVEEKTAAGVIIPETAKEKPSTGEVIAVGEGSRNEKGELVPTSVQVGDKVLFGKWSGTEVKDDGQEYLILKETDIFAIMK